MLKNQVIVGIVVLQLVVIVVATFESYVLVEHMALCLGALSRMVVVAMIGLLSVFRWGS